MTPEDLLRSCGRLRIKGDNGFEEISDQKIIYSETWGHVLTLFIGKIGSKKDKEKQSMKTECNRSIEGGTKQSMRSADGQKRSSLTVGQ
jgi:hypothetical protein